jgi:hypothetical protein
MVDGDWARARVATANASVGFLVNRDAERVGVQLRRRDAVVPERPRPRAEAVGAALMQQ